MTIKFSSYFHKIINLVFMPFQFLSLALLTLKLILNFLHSWKLLWSHHNLSIAPFCKTLILQMILGKIFSASSNSSRFSLSRFTSLFETFLLFNNRIDFEIANLKTFFCASHRRIVNLSKGRNGLISLCVKKISILNRLT